MSRPSSRPGPSSLVALRWLARVGASPREPLALVMRWSDQAMHDHVARLARAGMLTPVRMTHGDGSLLVITREGARMVDGRVGGVPRSVAPTTWAHAVACAWTAAWFEVRGRDWRSSHEITQDNRWRGRVVYQDGYGRTHRVTHRPDLGTYVGDACQPVAVEVELQRKSAARLRGILSMYEARTAPTSGDLAGVAYVATSNVTKGVQKAAAAVGLGEHPHGRLRLFALEDVIAQTREVAREQRAALRLTERRNVSPIA